MLRFSEVLFLVPPLVLIVLRLYIGAMPNRRLLFGALMSMVVLSAALAWFGNARALRGTYVPATLQGGVVVAGHAAP